MAASNTSANGLGAPDDTGPNGGAPGGTVGGVAVWSSKAGVGVSSVAAMLAIAGAEHGQDTLLVDLGGDAPALFGIDEPTGPGVAEWSSVGGRDPKALQRIETPVRPGLGLVHRGSGDLGSDAGALIQALESSKRSVVIDAGRAAEPLAAELVGACEQRLLVVRLCYLTLRAARGVEPAPTGVVLINEPGRALGRSDVQAVVAAPIVADIALDRSIARSLDAGLNASRLPRSLLRRLGQVLPYAA